MPLDPYSLCPGGRDKKIRFCCPDMVKDIEQIERLLDSKQSGACLTYIENLEKTHPDCACLTAAKLSIFRLENRWNDALPLAKHFADKEPENPVAAAEYALALGMTGEVKLAISVLIDAFERSKEGTIHSSLLNGLLQVAMQLFITGNVLPVIAICNRLKTFQLVADQANSLLYRATSMVDIPLLLRDMLVDNACPDDFPGKADFEDGVEYLGLLQWKRALAKFESLTQYADRWPNIWRNVAAVRFWLLDDVKGCEALRTFASLPNTPPEDAMDAEATRLFMSEDSLGDKTELFFLEYPIKDADKAIEKLLSSPNFVSSDFDTRAYVYNNVAPPRQAFVVLDKPFVKTAAELSLQTVSTQIASALLFGKETDREARLEVMEVLADDKATFEGLLKNTLGDLIGEAAVRETNRTMSLTHSKIQRRFRVTPEVAPDPETVAKLAKEYFNGEFIDFWCNHPLGLLDGKTPKQAVADKKYLPRLQGAVQVVEYWLANENTDEFDANLRVKLGLPGFGKIAVPQGADADLMEVLDSQPVWRWYRFDVEKFPQTVLIEGLQVLSVMKEPRALTAFGKELLNRPMKETPTQFRYLAFEGIIDSCLGSGKPEEALEWVEKAKNEAMEEKRSDAVWNFHEITIMFALGQTEKAIEVINHLAQEHGREKGVMEALNNLLIRMGVLNPDGTPSAAARQAQGGPQAEDRGGLWTPDAETGASTGSTSKLWTPD